MTWTVYGLRLRGDTEARYIGQTRQYLDLRIAAHFSLARRTIGRSEFAEWLIANQAKVELFKVAYCDTLEDARQLERVAITLCLRLNHRLFNRDHVPKHLRLVEPRQEAAA